MRRYESSSWSIVTFIALAFIISVIVLFIQEIKQNSENTYTKELEKAEIKEKVSEEEKEVVELPEEKKEEEEKKENPPVVETPKQETPVVNHYRARLTSFWPSENNWENKCTASGLCMDHMTENEYGWYMYKGRLAIATASTRLGSTNQKTYKLFQELNLVINGKTYPAVVVDVCGACQRNTIIDLYVKDGAHSISTYVEVYF